MLLIAKMVTFFESLRIGVLDSLYYLLNATLKFHTALKFHSLGVLVHFDVKLFHLFITVNLLCLKLCLSRSHLHDVEDVGVQAVSLDLIKLLLADFASAA